jgi:hypothetical protein
MGHPLTLEAQMFLRTRKGFLSLVMIASLLILACEIEEDLRIESDGSGRYSARISVPKELGDFGELRKEAEKNGFAIMQEGETPKERFIVIRKDFTDISALNDSHARYELTMTESGFLRREYRLRASLEAIGFGSFKRRLTVAMPGKVSSTTHGEIDGSRVKWDTSAGGSLEIASAGFHLPLSRNQSRGLMVTIIGGALLLLALRFRRRRASNGVCLTCNSPLRNGVRFCGICGANTPVAEA